MAFYLSIYRLRYFFVTKTGMSVQPLMNRVLHEAIYQEGGFMQINAVGMANGFYKVNAPLRADVAKTNTESVFGAQCRVTISREGRKLSRQMNAAEPKSFTAAGAERILLRQQKEEEMSRSEQADTLSEISGLMSAIRSSSSAGEDKETIANKQEALNRLLDLKAQQEEENKRRSEEAAANTAGASMGQEEIDRRNEDLYLLLKTLEEKDEEERTEGSGDRSDTADTENGQGGAVDRFQESASALGVSAARRELAAKGMIDDMYDSGYGRLAEAGAMMHEIHAELDLAAEASVRENLSEDERNQLMSEHIQRAGQLMSSNYGEMMDLRRKGHQEIQDAKELEQRHITVNPLDGVDRAKQTILDAGAAAALNEVSQDTLDRASEELEKKVQEELDKRNDVVSGTDDDDAQKKAEELADEKEKEAKELEQQENEKVTIHGAGMR